MIYICRATDQEAKLESTKEPNNLEGRYVCTATEQAFSFSTGTKFIGIFVLKYHNITYRNIIKVRG